MRVCLPAGAKTCMLASMRNRVHLMIGLLTLAAFIASGVYLRLHVTELAEGSPAVRIAFRSNHIYLLMSGLINLVLGLYAGPFERRRPVRMLASVLILAAPVLLTAAFVREPAGGNFDRPLTRFGVISLVVGVVVHAITEKKPKRAAASADVR
jgi:hypothetical protein